MNTRQAAFVLRLSEMKDAASLMELDQVVWNRETAPEPLHWTSRDQYLLHNPPGTQVVAFLDDCLCGYVGHRPPTGLASNRHVWEIHIAVHPSWQRQGVGFQLMEAMKAMARSEGIRKLRLRVLSSNPGAQAFYTRCDFIEEGRLVQEFDVDGRFVDDILMRCFL